MNFILLLFYFVNLVHSSYSTKATCTHNFKWPSKYDSNFNITCNAEIFKTSIVLFKAEENRHCILLKQKKSEIQYLNMKIKRFFEPKISNQFKFNIQFEPDINGKLFKLYYISKGCQTCEQCEREAKPEMLIYQHKINLLRKFTIHLTVKARGNSISNDQKEFNIGNSLFLSCQAFDGLTMGKMYIKIGNDILYSMYSNNNFFNLEGTNEILKKYHNKLVSCSIPSLNQEKSQKIFVNHPPTDTKLSIPYDGFIQNGSSVKCIPKDGYPPSTVEWKLKSIEGPLSAHKLFKINPSDTVHVLTSAHKGTKFTLSCNLYHTQFGGKKVSITRNYTFTITDKSANFNNHSKNVTKSVTDVYARLSKAVIGASIAGCIIFIIALVIAFMVCRSKSKTVSGARKSITSPDSNPITSLDDHELNDLTGENGNTNQYAGSLIVGSKSQIKNQVNNQNGSSSPFMNDYNYDDMPRGRRPIKVLDGSENSQKSDPVVYSTIVGTMQPKNRPSLDIGPIDRV